MAEHLTSRLEELTKQLIVRADPPHNQWETKEWGLRLKLNLIGKPRVGIDDTDYTKGTVT